MTLRRSLERLDAGPFPGADLPKPGHARATERKGRHGSGAFAAAGAADPLRGVSTRAPYPQFGPYEEPGPALPGDLLVRYLATDSAFEGVGVARASRLREAFGEDLARVLGSGDVHLVAEVIGRDRAETLIAAWQEHLAEADVAVWLSERGFDASLGVRAVRFWGAGALQTLRCNPYVMVAIASWPRVDEAARKLGFGLDHPHRRVAAVEAAAYRRLDRGHTWSSAADLEKATSRILAADPVTSRQAIASALADAAIVECDGGYQPVGAHVMERFVADTVASMMRTKPQDDLLVGRRAIKRILETAPSAPAAFALTDEQQAAVTMALTSPVSLILGGAGVGKTASLSAIHQAADAVGLSITQMALSGRAAVRMREATGREARTIAGFLRACERGQLKLGPDRLVVVDEGSMLDLPLIYLILRRLGLGTRLLLVGDPFQLPPIKFGLPFHILAETNGIPRVTLTRVHRQTAKTGIPSVALAIRGGRAPAIPGYRPGARAGVSFLECEPGDAMDGMTAVLSDIGDVGGETRVLSPVRKGPVGVEAINAHLHRIMSPGQARSTERPLAVGDPVMFTRNDYTRDLQNGSLGKITGFPVPGVAYVDFDGRRLALAGTDLTELALAYALTVHKSQGSQFRRIVLPMFAARMMDRTMLYTAITRAVEQVVLVGDRAAFAAAVREVPASLERQTGLRWMLARALAS